MKTAERDMARKLRGEDGLAITEIARRLRVSKSSVSLWVRDIVLSPEQHEALYGVNALYYRQAFAHFRRSATFRQQRIRWQVEGRVAAAAGNPVHAAGCMLFWAEGSKSRNAAQLANSDPEVIRFFVSFLRLSFNVPDEQFRVACNLFSDHLERQREIEQFWLVSSAPRATASPRRWSTGIPATARRSVGTSSLTGPVASQCTARA
jgi:transcriptional regulator with XRE-family HTH domain